MVFWSHTKLSNNQYFCWQTSCDPPSHVYNKATVIVIMLSLTCYRVSLWSNSEANMSLSTYYTIYMYYSAGMFNLENAETVWGDSVKIWQAAPAIPAPTDGWRNWTAAQPSLTITLLHNYLRSFSSSTTHLLLGGHLSRDQQPEEALGQRLLTSGSCRQQLLTLWNAVAPEADALCINGERRKYIFKLILKCTIKWVLASCQRELWLYQDLFTRVGLLTRYKTIMLLCHWKLATLIKKQSR